MKPATTRCRSGPEQVVGLGSILVAVALVDAYTLIWGERFAPFSVRTTAAVVD